MFTGGFTTAGSTGQQQPTATSNFGFQAPPNASPFTFGGGGVPAATAAPTFGGGAGGSFTGFGTAPQQPAAATAAPFSFGAPAAAATATASPAAPTFGSFTGFGTGGQPAAPTATPAAPFSFGLSTAPTSTAPSFGAPAFGSTTTAATPAPGTGGFGGFGATTTQASTGLTLNQGGTQPPAFSFGTTTTSAAPTFGTGTGGSLGGFGQQAAPATTAAAPFSFGLTSSTAPASTSAPSFGLPTSAATTAAATGGFSFGTTPASTGLSLNLGATQPPAFSFGSTAAAPVTTSAFGFNLGGTAVSSTATQPTASTTSTFAGLGGVQASSAGLTGSGMTGSSKPEGRAVLDMPIPAELLQMVEDFKNHMKNQKVKMSEICRANDKNIDKVTEEVEETRISVSHISNQVQRQVLFCNGLMKEIQEEMKNLEMAMVTKDTPLVLQNEITAPSNYFYKLVSNYHERMVTYKREIERAEIALSSLSQNNTFSPQDLVQGLKGTKETVIALAAKVQDLHEHLVNEMAVNRNLKRFPMEGEGRRGGGGGGGIGNPHHSVHGQEQHFVGTAYDQAYNKLNVLFHTPQRSGSNESFYRPHTAASTPLSGGMASEQLFHTASSTILSSPAGGLKRTKH